MVRTDKQLVAALKRSTDLAEALRQQRDMMQAALNDIASISRNNITTMDELVSRIKAIKHLADGAATVRL